MQDLLLCFEVRSLVAALTPKIEESQFPLRGQELSNAIYGMQTLEDSFEARRRSTRSYQQTPTQLGDHDE